MKLFRLVVLGTLSVAFLLGFNSCKKITEDQIINGLWSVQTVYIGPGSTTNYLLQLPHYADGNDCCYYKLDFERDGVVVAYYLTYDSLNSIEAGSWELNSGSEIQLKVGTFLDGTFTIEKPTLKHWRLTSAFNHVMAYDSINPALDTTLTIMEMKKL
jgi:hypothetical protein